MLCYRIDRVHKQVSRGLLQHAHSIPVALANDPAAAARAKPVTSYFLFQQVDEKPSGNFRFIRPNKLPKMLQ